MAKVNEIPHCVDGEDNIVPMNIEGGTAVDYAAVKIMVVAVDVGHQLIYSTQEQPDSSDYTKWEKVDGKTYLYHAQDSGTTKGGDVTIAAVDAASKTVQYFVENPNQHIDDVRWLPREDLGSPNGMDDFSVVRISNDVNGEVSVIVTSDDAKGKKIWWNYRNPPRTVEKKEKIVPPGADKPIEVTVMVSEPSKKLWSGWVDISGSLQGGFKTMFICNNADGRLVIVGTTAEGFTWVRQQSSKNPYDPDMWSDWVQPGDGDAEGAQYAKPVLDDTGVVSIFANFNGKIYRSRQSEPGSDKWLPWSVPGRPAEVVGAYDVSIDGDGCLFLAALSAADGGTKVYGNREYNTVENKWVGWEWINEVPNADYINLSYNADGSLTCFVLNPGKNTFKRIRQINVNSSEWYAKFKQFPSKIMSFSVTRDLTP